MTPSLSKRVLERDQWCVYCRASAATCVDHVLPKSRGGSDSLNNLVGACRPCNLEKLDYTPEEWRAYRERHLLPWPPPGLMNAVRSFSDDEIAELNDADVDLVVMGARRACGPEDLVRIVRSNIALVLRDRAVAA